MQLFEHGIQQASWLSLRHEKVSCRIMKSSFDWTPWTLIGVGRLILPFSVGSLITFL